MGRGHAYIHALTRQTRMTCIASRCRHLRRSTSSHVAHHIDVFASRERLVQGSRKATARRPSPSPPMAFSALVDAAMRSCRGLNDPELDGVVTRELVADAVEEILRLGHVVAEEVLGGVREIHLTALACATVVVYHLEGVRRRRSEAFLDAKAFPKWPPGPIREARVEYARVCSLGRRVRRAQVEEWAAPPQTELPDPGS